MSGMPTIDRDGVGIYYSDTGTGPPVFFHTGGGGDGTMWQRAGYLHALPGRHHVLIDHRGHGRSDQPHEPAAHLLDEYVKDAIAVLDAAHIERATMVGYSDGARLIYTLAARHPDRVETVVGIGGVSHPDDKSDWRRELAAEVRAKGFQRWLGEISEGETQPAPGWLMDNLGPTSDEMFLLELEGWADAPNEYEAFPRIQAPVLIVCGELEDTDGASAEAISTLPNGTAIVMPGFGHLQAFWRTDVTAPIISDFLARHVPVGVVSR